VLFDTYMVHIYTQKRSSYKLKVRRESLKMSQPYILYLKVLSLNANIEMHTAATEIEVVAGV
jgi:hypothetical protein